MDMKFDFVIVKGDSIDVSAALLGDDSVVKRRISSPVNEVRTLSNFHPN